MLFFAGFLFLYCLLVIIVIATSDVGVYYFWIL